MLCGCAAYADVLRSVESLQKLHKRLKITDTYLDDHYDPSLSKNTTRAAWAEVRDNLDRGA